MVIITFLFNRLLNQLRVFVTRSRHKCSIGLNRLRVIWDFNKNEYYLIDDDEDQIDEEMGCLFAALAS